MQTFLLNKVALVNFVFCKLHACKVIGEREHMIRPLLIIGVGGAGGKTIRAVKQELNRILEDSGYTDGLPAAWQFLQIDTVIDGVGFPAPMLSEDEIHCVVPHGVSYREFFTNFISRFNVQEQQTMLAGWVIPPLSIAINSAPPKDRAIGRLVGLADLANINNAIKNSISKMQSPTAHFQIEAVKKCFPEVIHDIIPQVFIFSSLGGATGSGIFMDIAEVIKCSTNGIWVNEATTFLYTPDVFESIGSQMPFISMNALGAMNEIISAQWNDASEQTKNLFTSFGLISQSNSARGSYGSKTNFLIDSKIIIGIGNLTNANEQSADELVYSFAEGFTNALISGTVDFYPSYPIDLFQPSNASYKDESGLMPEKFANSFSESTVAFSFNPFWTFTALTEPILKQVAQSKNQVQTWDQFWDGRRSRPLIEAIPFETEMRRSIITGWFIARLFGMGKVETVPAGRTAKVWNPTLQVPGWSTFPSPLISTAQVDTKRESWILPQLLVSAGIALSEFGKSGNPEFIYGYRLLKFLGREVTTSFENRDHWDGKGLGDMLPTGMPAQSQFMKDWIENGTKPASSLELLPLLQEHVDASGNRAAALIASVEKQRAVYNGIWDEFSTTDWHKLPETWELRSDIDLALSDIAAYIRNV
jgi:hypothetical protein